MRVQKGTPLVVLAPMEGITDAALRGYFTRTGYYDYCVTEFVRVSSHVLPPRVFRQEAPEILNGAKTSSGIPVVIQLLGGDAEKMAETALNAVEAGAKNIDINFGCPAPTVNRHDGGATLLKYPDRLEKIVRTIRDHLPQEVTVSAKLRLGFDDPTAIYENARRAEQGGADWITIHGRTRMQGYMPPAYWKPIGEVREALSIPVIANGEIFSVADFRRCREESGAEHFMLGRSALGVPGLALAIRKELGLSRIPTPEPLDFPDHDSSAEWAQAFLDFSKIYAGIHAPEKRLKQWTKYLSKHHPKGGFKWWDEIKVLNSVEEIVNHLKQRSPRDSNSE